jgi:glycosyltransferase involved in cell wall biosynthesis
LSSPTISVALVTRNRPESLQRTLASLRQQKHQPAEVLVSDDSDDQRADATRSVAEAFGCRYTKGPGRGLYANRNAAALGCSGSHIRSMDDDHEFPPGHWEVCEEAVHRDANSVWIIGEVTLSSPGGRTDECPGELHPRGFSVPPRDRDNTWAIADGASIYPAAVFSRGVLFSEAFRIGASYLEFGSRLHKLGYRIRYLSGTYILHRDTVNKSFYNREEDMAARVFATLSHSFSYQPTAANMALTVAQIVRELASGRGRGLTAVRRGYRAYRIQQQVLRLPRTGSS